MSKNFLSGHRKWNTLAFRGRLMSLLAPARGMPALSAKDGFSRPSSIRTPGSHLGLISPRSLAYSICLDRLPLSFKMIYSTIRSEEHTSELQSRFDLVCRLLLEKQ